MENKVLVLTTDGELKEEVVTLENGTIGFKELSRLLDDGFIEHCVFSRKLYENNIDMWVDESGKLKNLKTGLVIMDSRKDKIVEVLAGNVIFTGFDTGGNTYPLTEEQMEIVRKSILEAVFYNSIEGQDVTLKTLFV